MLSCRNVFTVKALSRLFVSQGIPFVPKPALDFVEIMMFLSFKSIFLYKAVSWQMLSQRIEIYNTCTLPHQSIMKFYVKS